MIRLCSANTEPPIRGVSSAARAWLSTAIRRTGRTLPVVAALTLGLVGRATTVEPLDLPSLVSHADFVVHATVKSVRCEKRASASGVKIVTLVDVAVVETVVGTAPATLTLQFLGGQVGDETMRVDGMPAFRASDEDVLFVEGNGRTICPLPGMKHGRFSVVRDETRQRASMRRGDGTPLRSIDQIGLPLEAPETATRREAALTGMELGEFIQQIRSVAQSHALNRTK